MISMNKYNRLMEHVNPSPDLEQRLHDALINRRCANRLSGENTVCKSPAC